MCLAGQVPPVPATAVGAATMAQAGLSWLAAADPAGLTTAELADCLRALERAESMHTAARARVLAAFTAQGGYQDDGQGSAKTWLRWQTRVTGGAAAGPWAGRGGWPRIRRWPGLWRRGSCRSREHGRSARGRTCCPTRPTTPGLNR